MKLFHPIFLCVLSGVVVVLLWRIFALRMDGLFFWNKFPELSLEASDFGSSENDLVENLIQVNLMKQSRRILQTKKEAKSMNKPYFLVSPTNGTDITSHPVALLRCQNQTRCIQPQLQLQRKFKIYYCKHVSHGVRFYFLVREGLLLHPNIILVEDPLEADYIVYLPESAVWHKTECANPLYKNKTIVLDEGDHQPLFEPDHHKDHGEWAIYFKRSYVHRHDGHFRGYMPYLNNPHVFPMTYGIMEAYVRNTFPTTKERDLELVCTLRGSNHDPTRLRVRQWIEEYSKARGLKNYVAGQINSASRTIVSTNYLDQMYRAKIVVTSNPSDWEGDFRLMESLATGALIFVDHMYVPRAHPLIDDVHIVYYDNHNKTEIFDKLDKYRAQPELARRVAVRGYLHSMKFHRAANLIDYVFRTLEVKEYQKKRKASSATTVKAEGEEQPEETNQENEGGNKPEDTSNSDSNSNNEDSSSDEHVLQYTGTGYHLKAHIKALQQQQKLQH